MRRMRVAVPPEQTSEKRSFERSAKMSFSQPPNNGAGVAAKSQLVSKYFQSPSRTGSYIDAESPNRSDSISLPNGQRDSTGSHSHSQSQDSQRSDTPPNMSFSGSSHPAASTVATHDTSSSGQAGIGAQHQRGGSTQFDTTKWGVRYNNNNNAMHSQDQASKRSSNPQAPPQSESHNATESHENTQASTKSTLPPRKISVGSYTLQPIAYSPRIPSQEETSSAASSRQSWDEQSQASWEAGDDDASRKPPPKPPKIPEGGRAPQMPPLPPRLPLLYFEQDEGICQMDFAYQRPQHDTVTSPQVAQPEDFVEEDTTDSTTESTPTEPSPPESSAVDAVPERPQKPSPPPIDTFQEQNRPIQEPIYNPEEGDTIRHSQASGSQAQSVQEDESNRSFYWHSPSSNSASPKPFDEKPFDEGSTDLKADTPKVEPLATDTIAASGGLVGASALGFGGPSDWEHFGDYNAEEIDDEDLYVSKKPKPQELPDSSTPKTEQLPRPPPPPPPPPPMMEGEPSNVLLGAHGRDLSAQRGPILSIIEERASETNEDDTSFRQLNSNRQSEESFNKSGSENENTPTQTPDEATAPDFPSTQQEQVIHIPERTERTQSFISTPEIRGNTFSIDSVFAGHEQQQSANNGLFFPTDSKSPEDHRVVSGIGFQDSGSTSSSQKLSGDDASIHSKKSAEQIVIHTDVPSPRIVNTVDSSPRNSAGTNASKRQSRKDTDDGKDGADKTSQVTSPTDDGQGDIIISLEVPDTPPSSAALPSPLKPKMQESRPHTGSPQLRAESDLSPDLLRSGRISVFPNSIQLEDPYSGLDPWAKASLNRYVKMLREEANAQTDEDKYEVFANFTTKETKIRLTFYDMDDDSDFSEFPSRKPSKKKQNRAPDLSQAPPMPPPAQIQITNVDGEVSSQEQPKRQPSPTPEQPSEPRSSTPEPQRTTPPQDQPPVQPPSQPPSQPPAQPQQSSQLVESSQTDQPSQQQPPNRGRLNSKSKALPALPPQNKLHAMLQSAPPEERQQTSQPGAAKSIPLIAAVNKAAAQSGKEESFGTVDNLVKPEQNPGRPNDKARDIKEKTSGLLKGAPSLGALRKALDVVATKRPNAPASAPSQESTNSNGKNSTSNNVGKEIKPEIKPDSTSNGDGQEAKSSDGTNAEGKQYEGDKVENRKSIYRPFSTMLRQSSVRSGRSDGETIRSFSRENRDTSSIGDDSAFRHSEIVNGGGKRPTIVEPDIKAKNYRYTILEPLLSVVPHESVLKEEPAALTHLRVRMEGIPDDFAFIHKTVLAWDAEAKKSRERYEHERRQRQEQSEHRIDELFNSEEIGYSDISRLEEDAKRQEARKKGEEDREEVNTFVASVFDVVWARINYEIDQLQPLYEDCTRQVAESSAGKEMFEDQTGKVPIAPAMEILLILYHKLNVRHQKAFEAVLERDRRLKKTEVDPWYAIGAIDQVKRIKDRYEDAEKRAILDFCRQRDERANLLMDVLDQNTLRGVGANQDYMESVMSAVRRISLEFVGGGVGEDDLVATNDVLKAKTITTALARSSEQIVQTFHVADMLLNAADYEVSVANAKLSNADATAFRKLREAKAKEDQKLGMDLEHRMGLIKRDTARTQDEIGKLLMLIQTKEEAGNMDGETGDPSQVSLVDGEKEERLKSALDAARRKLTG